MFVCLSHSKQVFVETQRFVMDVLDELLSQVVDLESVELADEQMLKLCDTATMIIQCSPESDMLSFGQEASSSPYTNITSEGTTSNTNANYRSQQGISADKDSGATKRNKRVTRSSSSYEAPTSTSMSSDTPTPPQHKRKRVGERRHVVNKASNRGGGSTIARFQCRVCGLTRFLNLSSSVAGLPARECECGSSAMIVAAWVRVLPEEGGLMGGGLGRECVRCQRCIRLYCSESHLRRHHCRRQRRAAGVLQSAENTTGNHQETSSSTSQSSLGVGAPPTCTSCGETFIFDLLLHRHQRREHGIDH